MYIKTDADGNPEGFPISYENVQYLVGAEVTAVVTPEQLVEFNLAEIKEYHSPPNSAEADIDCHDIVRGEIVKNEDGTIEQLWSITELSLKEKIRRWVVGPRLSYLLQSDWTQVADSPLTSEEKAAWAEYRAKLRSITDDIDFNTIKKRDQFDWPSPPTLSSTDTKWANTGEDGIQP